MPVSEGFIRKKVNVLRDTGCNSAAVRSSFVLDTHLTGDTHFCAPTDETVRKFPVARVSVDTLHYKGELEAMYTKAPIYDLVIGNIPGSRRLKEPD